ncbi:MAG TPA: Hsp20/alpha crystallin family protein [Anaerolineae bacterium]|nr:Hsp20/alpha crystallin family protein [Anaerolineae bacterium]
MRVLRDGVPGQRWAGSGPQGAWRPPTDVYETGDCIVVKVEIAGMRLDDFLVSLEGRQLTIAGVRRDPAEKLAYQRMEVLYGRFETEVHLARVVDESHIEAAYEDGFLIVRLPPAKPRHVPVVTLHNH